LLPASIDTDYIAAVLHFFTAPARKPSAKPRPPASKDTTAKAGILDIKRYPMSLKSKLSSVITLAFATVALTTFAVAQEKPKTEDNAQKLEKHERGFGRHGMRGMRGGRGGEFRGMHGLRGIELTDAQKEQIRQIHEANKPTEAQMAEMKAFRETRKAGGEITEAQREQMKAFREQMRAKHELVRSQILAILTPEQRQQLEAKKAEMQKRREEFRQQRQEWRQKRDAAKPADKPTEN
jgi:protein CpxP